MLSPGQNRGTCGHVMALFDSHKQCSRCREKGVGDDPCVKKLDCEICKAFTPTKSSSFPLRPTSPGKNEIRRRLLLKPLLVLPPLLWTHQRSFFCDGYTRNLLLLNLLLVRRRELMNLPRLAVRRNPTANPGLMNSDLEKWAEGFARLEAMLVSEMFDVPVEPVKKPS